ncbi:971_t:CDS:2 [Scutellospora calospora]|uniref:971_t:CDS:1 n=1 Tax=Scutellospora calospora TaxID=85575 RepID=A0ACA9MQK8_9GLOM|nr:971_t:CDS:2 [Scutellospora calospora]
MEANSDSYDSSSDEEISVRLDKLEKEIATLSGINQKKIIEKSKKIFKIINKQLDQKEKKIGFLRDENYDLQGQNILGKIKNFIPQPFFNMLFEYGIDYIHPKK